jgi:hypothetical protein
MSVTVFMALYILGLDLLIYVFFHRIYGDKRSAVARQVAAFKRAVTKPFWVVSQKAGHWYQKSAHRENILPPNLQDGCPSPENNPTASAHAFLELFPFCTTAAAIWRLMQTMVTRRTRTTGLFVAA